MKSFKFFKRTIYFVALIMPFLILLEGCKGGGSTKNGRNTSKSSKGGKSSSKTTAKGRNSKKKGNKGDDVGISNGEIVATARKGYKQTTPFGMALIPSGSFLMGQTDEDPANSQSSFNKRVTISRYYMDDTEISNHEFRQFTNTILTDSLSVLGEEYIYEKLYPDTTVWRKDFTYHNGDPMTEYYFANPAFDTYPVVGVSWEAAKYFCVWRSKLMNDHRKKEGQYINPSFRLPSEAEWEWASRGGKTSAKYPWGGPYIANGSGCMLANFKPQRGNYDADGFTYTCPVTAFNPNDYGLYNMSGNVSEWCLDAYADNASVVTWDLNLVNDNPREPRKVIRGGSWKDVAYYLESSTRAFEYQDAKRSYIGFRCAMDHLGRSSNKEF